MLLKDENVDRVLCSDIPKSEEYSNIIYTAQEANKYLTTNYAKFNELNSQVWHELYDLMARCIARGVRLTKEGKY